jgi:hypothetical protein
MNKVIKAKFTQLFNMYAYSNSKNDHFLLLSETELTIVLEKILLNPFEYLK